MRTQAAINTITGAILGALVAMVLSLILLAAAGPDGSGLPAITPVLFTFAGAVGGGLIGLLNP